MVLLSDMALAPHDGGEDASFRTSEEGGRLSSHPPPSTALSKAPAASPSSGLRPLHRSLSRRPRPEPNPTETTLRLRSQNAAERSRTQQNAAPRRSTATRKALALALALATGHGPRSCSEHRPLAAPASRSLPSSRRARAEGALRKSSGQGRDDLLRPLDSVLAQGRGVFALPHTQWPATGEIH